MDWNKEKSKQLGMSYGKASHILRKSIIFDLLTKLGLDKCFRCGGVISSVDELHIDHKEPWLHSPHPTDLFFDIDNIGFSHPRCNIKACRPRHCNTSGAYSKSGFKGVYELKNPGLRKRWVAYATIKGKRIRFGSYYSPEEAASAYDLGVTQHFGSKAVTNKSLKLL